MSGGPAFDAWLQAEILKAFDLEPWHVGLAPPPQEVRLRAALARSWRRAARRRAGRLRIGA